jgi:hypothetical protein
MGKISFIYPQDALFASLYPQLFAVSRARGPIRQLVNDFHYKRLIGMNSVSTIKSAGPAKQTDRSRPTTSALQKNIPPAESTVLKLNELAKKAPLLSLYKKPET